MVVNLARVFLCYVRMTFSDYVIHSLTLAVEHVF